MAHTLDHISSPISQSDRSISGDYSQAKIVSQKRGWADLDLSLKLHPIRKDIIPLKDDRAIKNAVRNLLITNFFERPFGSSKGANLRGLLFEPADGITRMAIRDNIRRVLAQHEPRIQIISISVTNQSDDNAYNILLHFKIKEFDLEQEVEIVLRRLR